MFHTVNQRRGWPLCAGKGASEKIDFFTHAKSASRTVVFLPKGHACRGNNVRCVLPSPILASIPQPG